MLVKPAREDPQNSVDLFDADRKNDFGETYCVAPAILRSEVAERWIRYEDEQGICQGCLTDPCKCLPNDYPCDMD